MPKLKTLLQCSLILVAGLAMGYLYSNHRAAESASIALSEWNARMETVTQINAGLEAKIRESLDANKALEAANQQLREDRKAIGQQLAQANSTIEELKAKEPSYPGLESHPLVINLRLQLKEQDRRFSLAMEDVAKANAEIANQGKQIKGLEQAYQNAYQMYLNSSQLNLDAGIKIARLSRQNATVKTMAKGEGVVIFILTVIALVK